MGAGRRLDHQGFLWGFYLNGIGCWGRGTLLPCAALQVMLRTDSDDCVTVQDHVYDPFTGETTVTTRTVPASEALPMCMGAGTM